MQGSIRPDETTVFTDAWGSYKALSKLGIDHRPRKGAGERSGLALEAAFASGRLAEARKAAKQFEALAKRG